MDKKTLERANELTRYIYNASNDIENIKKVDVSDGKFICIANKNNIHANEELLGKVIDLVVDYKTEQIKNWQKELDEL